MLSSNFMIIVCKGMGGYYASVIEKEFPESGAIASGITFAKEQDALRDAILWSKSDVIPLEPSILTKYKKILDNYIIDIVKEESEFSDKY